MTRITEEQFRRNRDARQGWELYANHRAHVTRSLLSSVATSDATLCVLGAGNCNDLDLQQLKARFQSIDLVDLDDEALFAGCEQQGVADDPAIRLHGKVDVTGVAQRVESWQLAQLPSADEINQTARDALLGPLTGVPSRPFDVVASVGLLTQLIEMVDGTLGARHPQFLNLMPAVRLRHLRLLLELTKPGGTAWLLTEVVSSLTCPELLTTSESNLMPVLQRAVAQQNFFTGVNPAIIQRLFQEDPVLKAGVARLEVPLPWLWSFFTRTYAVVPFRITRRG
jgi:hypothetical protein